MTSRWTKKKESWIRQAAASDDVAIWAINAVKESEKEINKLDDLIEQNSLNEERIKKIEAYLKKIRGDIKGQISMKESSLDGISLNPSNSSKLQLSVPANLNYLMKAWAAAEGRDLSSVALECLETGLRLIKSKGSIPIAAVRRYDLACEKRIALSEANFAWNEYEDSIN